MALGKYSCYVHVLLTGSEPLTYSNYIFTEFDNCRIACCGKRYIYPETPLNFELISQEIKELEVSTFQYPHRALQEFLRVLRPGGRVALTTWTEDCPFLGWVLPAIRASLPPQTPPTNRGQEPPRFDTPAKLETALQQVGFESIEINIEDHDFVYTNDEEWWLSLWSHGIRSRFEGLEASALEKLKADMLGKVQVLKQPDGIHLLLRALFAFGHRPNH